MIYFFSYKYIYKFIVINMVKKDNFNLMSFACEIYRLYSY